MRAMSALIRDAGMSTRVRLAITAFRIRVSMSAIGSVIESQPSSCFVLRTSCLVPSLPAAFRDTGDVALERQLPEAQAAQRKLPHVGARAPAQVAAVPKPDLEFRRLLFFRDLGGSGHCFLSS